MYYSMFRAFRNRSNYAINTTALSSVACISEGVLFRRLGPVFQNQEKHLMEFEYSIPSIFSRFIQQGSFMSTIGIEELVCQH